MGDGAAKHIERCHYTRHSRLIAQHPREVRPVGTDDVSKLAEGRVVDVVLRPDRYGGLSLALSVLSHLFKDAGWHAGVPPLRTVCSLHRLDDEPAYVVL